MPTNVVVATKVTVMATIVVVATKVSAMATNVVVAKGEKEYLIPALPAAIENPDPDANTMTVHLLKGMAADEN